MDNPVDNGYHKLLIREKPSSVAEGLFVYLLLIVVCNDTYTYPALLLSMEVYPQSSMISRFSPLSVSRKFSRHSSYATAFTGQA